MDGVFFRLAKVVTVASTACLLIHSLQPWNALSQVTLTEEMPHQYGSSSASSQTFSSISTSSYNSSASRSSSSSSSSASASPTPTPEPTDPPKGACLTLVSGISEGEGRIFKGAGDDMSCLSKFLEPYGSSGNAGSIADLWSNYIWKCGSDKFELVQKTSGAHWDFGLVANGALIYDPNSGQGVAPENVELMNKANETLEGRCPEPGGTQVTTLTGAPVGFNPYVDYGTDDGVAGGFYREAITKLDPTCVRNLNNAASGSFTGRSVCSTSDKTMQIALDKECNFFDATNTTYPLCGEVISVHYKRTPLSLIWNHLKVDQAEKLGEETLVKFPVDPSLAGKLFTWRASEDFPLVVYDPEKSGQIKDGTQLFGNFTFGKSWKNGYEALASLDADRSGKIEGSELDPLSLWFDRNRDGVSDRGEVMSLSDAAVTALYYKSDKLSKSKNENIATTGFEVSSAGRLITGPSVDWLSTAVESLSHALVAPKEDSKRSSQSKAKDPINDRLSGVWFWKEQNSSKNLKKEPTGALILTVRGETVTGISLTQVKVADNRAGIKYLLMKSLIEGSVHKSPGGEEQLQFIAYDDKNNVVENSALIGADKKLDGTSVMKIKGINTPLRFGWKAEKG